MDKKVEEITVDYTLEQNLCISCGVCAGVCPVNCIEMQLSKEGDAYRPVIDKERCIRCGKCKRVCPGLGWQIFEPDESKSLTELSGKGQVLAAYSAWVKDEELLKSCVSGGMATVLVKELLEKGVYEKAFLVDSYQINEKLVSKPMEAGFSYEKTGGSRYTPVSHEEAVRYMRKNREERLIFVGVACAINGILNVIREEKLNREQYLFIGLFCDKTLNRHVFTYFDSLSEGNLKELYYRSKKQKGWPGNVRLVFENGEETFLPAGKRMEIKEYMQMRRCLYCYDKLNESCDIALGDNYTKKDANPGGSNSVIVRTKKGEEALECVKDKIEKKAALYEDIYQAQGMTKRNEQLEFAQLLREEQGVLLYQEWKERAFPVSKQAKKQYVLRQAKLKTGQNFEKDPQAFFAFRKEEEKAKIQRQKREKILGLPRRILSIPKKVLKKIVKS